MKIRWVRHHLGNGQRAPVHRPLHYRLSFFIFTLQKKIPLNMAYSKLTPLLLQAICIAPRGHHCLSHQSALAAATRKKSTKNKTFMKNPKKKFFRECPSLQKFTHQQNISFSIVKWQFDVISDQQFNQKRKKNRKLLS